MERKANFLIPYNIYKLRTLTGIYSDACWKISSLSSLSAARSSFLMTRLSFSQEVVILIDEVVILIDEVVILID